MNRPQSLPKTGTPDTPAGVDRNGGTVSTGGVAAHDADDERLLAALGQRVRDARAKSAMSRKTLAVAAGVSERYLAQLESGETNPSIIQLCRVGRALGVALTDLLAAPQDSVEERLIRRLLERLPPQRLEDAIMRLMRDLGADTAERRKRVALVGLRGAGKSTLGRKLATELDVRFVELNREIEADAGMSLNEIFMLYGQAGYRRIERRSLERLIEGGERAIITVGGGIVSEPDTFNLLLENCFTVWIKASPEEHMARVVAQGDLRPMAGSAEAMEDLRRILAAREPLYRRADVTIDTTAQRPEDSLAKLRDALNH